MPNILTQNVLLPYLISHITPKNKEQKNEWMVKGLKFNTDVKMPLEMTFY